MPPRVVCHPSKWFAVAGKNILKEIESAILLEEQAMDFYAQKAEIADSEAIKAAFVFLSKQESGHRKILILVEASIKGNLAWPSKETGELFSTPLQVKAKSFMKREKKEQENLANEDEVSMLLWAMRSERRAESLYAELKGKSTGKLQRLFGFLEKFENSHYALLDGLVEELTDPSDYLES